MLSGPALATFVAVIVALELLSRWVVAPLTLRGGVEQLHAISHEVWTSSQRPLILFLGTSHVQYAIVPAIIERHFGLERGTVLNAGMGFSGPYEQMRLYRNVESALAGARLAVLETSPMYFNRTLAIRARLRLDLLTRLRYPADPLTRADWLLGWAFSMWDARRTWRSLASSAARSALRQVGLERARYDGDGYPGDPVARIARDELPKDAEYFSAIHFQTYSFDEDAVRDFTTLLKRIEKHGTRVLLLEYPVSPAYQRLLETRYLEAKEREQAALAGPLAHYPVLRVDPAREAELIGEFRDSHHLTREGATRFSAMIAEMPEVRAIGDATHERAPRAPEP